jgi:hypothetical protein
VLIGSFFSSRAPDRYIRPIITFVIFASGLKYIGVATTVLGWILCAVALTAGVYWLFRTQPWRNGNGKQAAATANGAELADANGSGAAPPDTGGDLANGEHANGQQAAAEQEASPPASG